MFSLGDLIADCFTCQENGHWKGVGTVTSRHCCRFSDKYDDRGGRESKYDEGGEGEDQLGL